MAASLTLLEALRSITSPTMTKHFFNNLRITCAIMNFCHREKKLVEDILKLNFVLTRHMSMHKGSYLKTAKDHAISWVLVFLSIWNFQQQVSLTGEVHSWLQYLIHDDIYKNDTSSVKHTWFTTKVMEWSIDFFFHGVFLV